MPDQVESLTQAKRDCTRMKDDSSESVTQLAIEKNKQEQEMQTLQLELEQHQIEAHKQLEQQHQLVLTMQEELLGERATIAHLQEQVRNVHTTNCKTSEKVPPENAY